MLRLYILALLIIYTTVCCGALLGIDYGSEYIKVVSVQPGKAFHVILDETSKRKVPQTIGYYEKQRHFGNHGQTLSVRKPQKVFQYGGWLLGKRVNDPQLKRFHSMGFPYNIRKIDERGDGVGVEFTNYTMSPEELNGQMFEYLRKLAEDDAGLPVTDAVITIPAFYTQQEKESILAAAKLGGLNVLSLVAENTAAAIQYAIDLDYKNTTNELVAIYNMGSAYTQVGLYKYSSYNSSYRKQAKVVGQFEVVGQEYDSTLGGLDFNERLVRHMMAEVQTQVDKVYKGSKKIDVTKQERIWSKLRAQARRVKERLSANKDSPIYVESVYGDVDYRSKITRDSFEEMCADLFDRALVPLVNMLTNAGVSSDDVKVVILVGGSTRVPKLLRMLRETVGTDKIGHTLNADEAMGMGAAFMAANISTQFRVRRVGMVGKSNYKIGVEMSELPDAEVPEGTEPFNKRAVVFKAFSKLEKRKQVGFRHNRSFALSLDVLNTDRLPAGADPHVASYRIEGVEEVVADPKNAKYAENGTLPRVALSFKLSLSGTVELVKAEAQFKDVIQVNGTVYENRTVEVEDKEAMVRARVRGESGSSSEGGEGGGEGGEAATKGGEGGEGAKTATEEQKKESKKTKKLDKTPKIMKNVTKLVPVTKLVNKTVTRRTPLRITKLPGAILPVSGNLTKLYRKRLRAFREADVLKARIGQAKNNLESFIYGTRSKLYDEIVETVSTEEQREAITAALSAAEEWIYEVDDDEPTKFEHKLSDLRGMYASIEMRISEYEGRPEALNATKVLLNYSRMAVAKMVAERPWVPETKLNRLRAMIESVESWVKEKTTEQDAKPLYEDPVYTVEEVYDKLRPLTTLSSDLLKLKKPKPKKTKAPKNATATATNSTASANTTTTTTAETGEATASSSEASDGGEGEQQDKTESGVKDKEEPQADSSSSSPSSASDDQSGDGGADTTKTHEEL